MRHPCAIASSACHRGRNLRAIKNMKINIRVIPRSSKNEIIKEENRYKIKITAAPVDGKANEAVIKLLSKEFDVPKSRIKIARGGACRDKVVEII